jgi:hypothetical protein
MRWIWGPHSGDWGKQCPGLWGSIFWYITDVSANILSSSSRLVKHLANRAKRLVVACFWSLVRSTRRHWRLERYGEGKVVLMLSTMPWRRMGNGCIHPRIIDLRTSWGLSGQLHAPPLYPRGKSPQWPLDRKLGEPHNRSGRREEEKNLVPNQDSNSDLSTVQSVASRYED